MTTRLALAFAVSLALTAGCLASGGEDPALTSANASEDEGTRSFTVTLEAFPEGADWIALDVEALDGEHGNVTFHLSERYSPTPELRQCWQIGATGHPLVMASMGQGEEIRVTARPIAEEPIASLHLPPVDRTWETDGPNLPMGADGRTTLLFGYHDADAWREGKAEAEFTVEADEPVRWRIAETGTMTCQTELVDYEQGTLVEAGGPTYAQDLRLPFEIEGEGYGAVFPHSTGRHDFELDGPNGTVVEEAKTTATEHGIIRGGTILEQLPAGEYEARVNELVARDQGGAPVLVTDVPPTLADRLRGSPG